MNAEAVLHKATTRLALLALHEWGALGAHAAELRERGAVARRARTALELMRDQADLLPETWSRLRQDQQVRRELLRKLFN